ncbi:MAG: hypothetical protein GXO43_01290 [Crenarchaeota archaeon]|nr:hypothetical protein [Thermoproteota archaeon]
MSVTYNIGGPLYIDQKRSLQLKPRKNLSRLILHEIRESNSTSIVGVYGKTGAGKSIYSMKIAYEFYRDWDKVLDYIIFTPFDFQEAIDYLEKTDDWIPVLIWDDAGPWMELMKRTSWHPLTLGIRGAFETMRLRVGAILMTMTNERSMPRSILYNGNLYKFRVRVVRNGHKSDGTPISIAEIQVRKEKRSDWGSYYWDTTNIYQDYFVLKTPNYSEYEELRRAYIKLYNKLIMASREIGPSKILDYIYEEWKKMRKELPRQPFYAKK